MTLTRQQDRRPDPRTPAAAPIQRAAAHMATGQTPRYGFDLVSPRHGLGGARAPSSARPGGLPEPLKARMEAMSGLSMDDVRVRRNSSRPAALGALAFTQGSEIHLGPGQERHLPHEAWHAVQQKQGRVRATLQMKGLGINAEAGLEREADAMALRAMQPQPVRRESRSGPLPRGRTPGTAAPVQRVVAAADEIARRAAQEPDQHYQHQVFNKTVIRAGKEVEEPVSYLIGTTKRLRYISDDRRGGYWKEEKKGKRTGAAGKWGRLTDVAEERAARTFVMVLAFLAMIFRAVDKAFTAKATTAPRPDAGRTMAEYFFGKANPGLPAKCYALRPYAVPGYEWLHMHGHGLGGPTIPDNLWAGSHAANSEMMAMEGGVNAASAIDKINVTVTCNTVGGHHTEANCHRIAGLVGLDKADVYARMKDKKSHLLDTVVYKAQSSKGSITTVVDAQRGGYFFSGGFKSLEEQTQSVLLKGGHVNATGGLVLNWSLKLLVLLLVAAGIFWTLFGRGQALAGPKPQAEL